MTELLPSDREYLSRLRALQGRVGRPVKDLTQEAPELALASLRDAVSKAPASYRQYLQEALACYEGGQLRGAVLMFWAATMQHLYATAEAHDGGIKALEDANRRRYGTSNSYRPLKKVDDFLYLRESQFLQLGEDAGMYNKTARKLLVERLGLRNDCGHPTGYRPGRGEVVIFIESLLQNIVSGHMISW